MHPGLGTPTLFYARLSYNLNRYTNVMDRLSMDNSISIHLGLTAYLLRVKGVQRHFSAVWTTVAQFNLKRFNVGSGRGNRSLEPRTTQTG